MNYFVKTFNNIFPKNDWTVKVLVYLLVIDFLVIGLHILLGDWSTLFHLDYEHNIPTIVQSLKLFTVGYLTMFTLIQSWKVLSTYQKRLLLPLSGLFIFIGLDELGQIHENVDRFVREISPEFADSVLFFAQSIGYVSSTWMIYYIPFFIFTGIYGLFLLHYILKHKPHHFFTGLLFGLLMFFVLLFEFVSNQGQVDQNVYQIYVTLEESAEMIGISIGSFLALQLLRDITDKKS